MMPKSEELWRAADPKRRQAQMDAAIPFKDLAKGKHNHAVRLKRRSSGWG